MQDVQVKHVVKEWLEDGTEAIFIGKKYALGEVTRIDYHTPQGEGDSHYVDVYLDGKLRRRIFKPDDIDFL